MTDLRVCRDQWLDFLSGTRLSLIMANISSAHPVKLLLAAIWLAGFCLGARAQTTNQVPLVGTNRFLAVITAQFPGWDLNHDGVLSSNELDVAAADPQTTNRAAAAVAALKRAMRNRKLSLPPLTLENIRSLTAQRQPDLARMFRECLNNIPAPTNRALFAKDGPRLNLIRQGYFGDCFCLAPLGAMVHRDPHAVAALFSLEINGNYRVNFGTNAVEVSPPTDAELALTAFSRQDGVWVNVYEKAAGIVWNDRLPPARRSDFPLDVLAHGGPDLMMLGAVTGHEITRVSFKFAKDPALSRVDFTNKLEALRAKLVIATGGNLLMICNTVQVKTPGLSPDHAYAVLNYQPATDAVEIWNPHGQTYVPKELPPGPDHGYPTKQGVFIVALPDFVKLFSGVFFEQPAKKQA